MAREYLDDGLIKISSLFKRMRSTPEFRTVYRICLAGDAVLSRLHSRKMRPNTKAARSIVRRIPLLVAAGQVAVGRIELRRLIELVFWTTYFSDHPVEWASFQSSPARGYAKTLDNPIDFCARRESAFYANYAKERMKDEPSGLARKAAESLRTAQRDLNAVVHPTGLAVSKLRIPPFESVGKRALVPFSRCLRVVVGHGCMILAALNRTGFDRLPPMYRAHFDWLIGRQRSKKLREGGFGLCR